MNFSIPAYLSNFSTLDDQRTVAKLKTFYVGETGDGRVFTKDFSEELVKSIAYTPVVAFYSDLKDDFIGHNGKQYIYGIVRPDAEYGFETDDEGVEWFITEVMLYTDRIDNIGEIAKKIVGHKQSLEMDPNSVEYEVFKEDGKTKVRFTKARLCGLSVLGEEQKPAFTGSEFFVENDDLRERFENFFSFLTNKDRGALMDKKEIFAQYVDFIKLTYNEKQRMVAEYAQSQYGDDYSVMVAEMSDEYVVVDVFSWADWSECFKMFDYTIDEQGVSLANERACYRRFLSLEQIEKLDASVSFAKDEEEEKPVEPEVKEDKEEEEFASQDDNKEEPEDEKDEEKEQPEDNKDEEEFVEDDKDEKDDEKESEDPEDDKKDDEDKDVYVEKEEDKEKEKDSTFTNLEGDNNEQKEDAELQETEESKENFTASAPELNNSEREELEAYRLKERLSLVDSYKDDLDADTISSFKEMAQSVSYSELEAKLAIKYREVSKTNTKKDAAVFSFNNVIMNTNTPKSYADLVRATLNK
jgi:hypothetical protein